MDHQTDDRYDSWLDGAPTWVRVVQAVLIGLVAGLALHIAAVAGRAAGE